MDCDDNLVSNGNHHNSTPWSSDNGRHHHHNGRQHNYNGESNDSYGGGGSSFPSHSRKRQHFNSGCADGGSVAKLYVGGVPRTVNEHNIRSLFGEHGSITEVIFLKDKRTSLQQECCFVKYAKFEDADKAIAVLHNQYMFPGVMNPIRVKYADEKERRRPDSNTGTYTFKLYVGCVNKQACNREIEEIFSPYGLIEDIFIARDEFKQSRGCAFVQFSHRDMAVAAISALNGTYIMRGCNQPLIVKFADPKKPKIEDPRPVSSFNDIPYRQWLPNASQQVSTSMEYCASLEPLSDDTSDCQDCDWSEHVCPDGYLYYYNCATCESRWEKPEEYLYYEQQLQKGSEQGHPHHKQLHISCSQVHSSEIVSQMQQV